MTVPPNNVKENLHRAYVYAVTAKAGANCGRFDTDMGADLIVSRVSILSNGKYQQTGFNFHCQLKATTTCEVNSHYIIYDMEAEDYNKLAGWQGASACFLIVFNLPEDEMEWLYMDEDQLLLKRCCYWHYIGNTPSPNTSSQRIKIPRTQLFTPDAVLELLEWQDPGGAP